MLPAGGEQRQGEERQRSHGAATRERPARFLRYRCEEAATTQDLSRFEAAQAGSFDQALAELRAGRKRSHWMWWIFPQIAGLGRSATAQAYAIRSLDEARAYLAHPLLGPRLVESARAVAAASGSAERIMGPIDAVKLRSSATLFAAAAEDEAAAAPFRAVLDRFWSGEEDGETLALI